MTHGNQKYDFEPLKEVGGSVQTKTANIYSLKTALRQFFGKGFKPAKRLTFEELPGNEFKVTRTS